MPSGLQIWDAAGNLVLDTNTWVSHVLGTFALPAAHAAGNLSVPALASGRPFLIVLPAEGNMGAVAAGNPVANTVTVSGTTITWNAAPDACQVIYGIY